eukprot:12679008-Alexandrium_andersonii.AAC.1
MKDLITVRSQATLAVILPGSLNKDLIAGGIGESAITVLYLVFDDPATGAKERKEATLVNLGAKP